MLCQQRFPKWELYMLHYLCMLYMFPLAILCINAKQKSRKRKSDIRVDFPSKDDGLVRESQAPSWRPNAGLHCVESQKGAVVEYKMK